MVININIGSWKSAIYSVAEYGTRNYMFAWINENNHKITCATHPSSKSCLARRAVSEALEHVGRNLSKELYDIKQKQCKDIWDEDEGVVEEEKKKEFKPISKQSIPIPKVFSIDEDGNPQNKNDDALDNAARLQGIKQYYEYQVQTTVPKELT